MSVEPLLAEKREGLQCGAGAFFLDPREPVPFAVVTHAHADHAVSGCGRYWCAAPSVALLRHRLGPDAPIEGVPYGETRETGPVQLSFHPAGHVLGSAQVRLEHEGSVWVATGDYKRDPDPTCAPFEPVRCDVLVTEASYALPIFRWDDPRQVIGDVFRWWQGNSRRASLLFCYVLGKAQRILAGLAEYTDRPVYVHGALEGITRLYREAGVRMVPTRPVAETQKGRSFAGELVLAPITARGTTWMRRFGDSESAFTSGSMRIRGQRRRRSFSRGFALSDHADWPGLLRTIEESGARRVLATHGYREALVRYLTEHGTDAAAIGLAHPTDPEGD
jgi:putative mRNA 3-end processing factor